MWASFGARAIGLDLTAAATIDAAAAAGFDAVDLLVRDALASGGSLGDLRRRMEDRGLRGGAWPLPVAWRGEAARFAADLRDLPRYARAAAELGLRATGTWVLPETPPDGRGRAEPIELHLRRLGAVARILDDHGSRLGLEAIGVASFRSGRGVPLVTRLADLDPLLGPLREERPNVGLVVDAFHLHAAGEPAEAALLWGVERVVWVHIADLPAGAPPDRAAIRDDQRGLPGESGAVEARGLLQLLARAGYEGPVTVETLAGCRSLAGLDPAAAARAVRASLRGVWPSQAPG
jgi:sugar phosphate isomerase/epimerase